MSSLTTTHSGLQSSAVVAAPYVEIQIKGKAVRIPSAAIDGRTVVAAGKWIVTASVMDEELLEGEVVANPDEFVRRVRHCGLNADIFTFAQKVPDVAPRHDLPFEWESAAVIPITTYADWLEHRVEYDVRKAVRKAARLGVVVKEASLDDEFVRGIAGIYDESPFRQGKRFWHYGKDLETVRRENSTYLDRSAFIGAYYQDELIGFIRMLYVDKVAATLQVLSKQKYFDKKPTNALIAKAVELCERKGLSHLVYGKYIYSDPKSTLTEFKRRNGFENAQLPRYYVPLTLKGATAMTLRLHHGLKALLPASVVTTLVRLRTRIHEARSASRS